MKLLCTAGHDPQNGSRTCLGELAWNVSARGEKHNPAGTVSGASLPHRGREWADPFDAAGGAGSLKWPDSAHPLRHFIHDFVYNVGAVLLVADARRGNWREGFGQRFGKYNTKLKQAMTNRHVLWIHAVSVGEVNLCTQLIRALEPRLPNVKIVVSTTTTTGMGELQKKLPTHVSKIYYPIDRRKYVARALATIHPEAVVLVEAEIWPNFIWRARNAASRVFLVNARLSERSYRGYRRFGFLFRPLFARFTGVGAQNESDAARLRSLGCRPEADSRGGQPEIRRGQAG